MIKLWSKFIQWSKYDHNLYKDQSMIKIHTMVKWDQFRNDQKLSLKNWLHGIFWSNTYYFYRKLRNRKNQWKPWYFPTAEKEKKNDPKMQLEARLGWKSDWCRSQIGTEARLAQRPDWLGSQIGWEARLAGRPT